jgi:NAD-dependent DNA ligase (contains BRCT domain type II)
MPPTFLRLKEGDLTPLARLPNGRPKIWLRPSSLKADNFAAVCYALGIRNVGEQTARALADEFGSFEK